MADDSARTQLGQEKKERNIVHVSSYGSIPNQLKSRIETVRFQIHDFVNLDCGSVFTDKFIAHGRLWELAVRPHTVLTKKGCNISVRIFGAGRNPTAYYKAVLRTKTITESTRAFNYEMEHFYFTKQDVIIRNECDAYGTFTIDVDLQVVTESPKKVWFPRSIELRKNDLLIQLYNSVDITGDVAFTVSTMEFRAHKCVLALEAKALYKLIEVEESSSSPSTSLTVITVENDCHNDDDDDIGASTKNLVTKIVLTGGVDEAAFGSMLEFIYTGNISSLQFGYEKNKHRHKTPWTCIGSILVTADRFGCSNLKLYAESLLVTSLPFMDNTVELLLFADSYSCALLKEECMDTYSHNPTVVVKEDASSWTKLQESSKLLSELLFYSTIEFHHRHNNINKMKEGGDDDDDDDDDRNAEKQHVEKYLDVSTLRDRLQEADVDVDGSRGYLLKWYRKLIHGETIITDKNE